MAWLVSCELIAVGIDINFAPVLDIDKGISSVIGNRSFSTNQEVVTEIGQYCINLYAKKKVASVIKHIPGHGLSKSDSHRRLPKINKSINFLLKNDFKCFKNTKSKFCVISFSSDWLYPTIENKEIVIALNACGANVGFVEINSDKGHDSFLLNVPEFLRTVSEFLNSTYNEINNEKRI